MLTFKGIECPSKDKIWDKIIPNKHRVFLSLAVRGMLNTRDIMIKKNWKITTHDGCDWCPASETIWHIILRCRLADVVWHRVGLQDIAKNCSDLQAFILSAEAMTTHDNLWHVLFAPIVVALWTARNALVFRSERWTAIRAFKEIHQLLYLSKNRARRDQDRATLFIYAAVFPQV